MSTFRPESTGEGSSGLDVYEYAILRAVPRLDRGEVLNVGVVLFCQPRDFLDCAVHVDPARLHALDPATDAAGVAAAAAAVRAVCLGGPGAGAAAAESTGARFRWLTAPRSTVVQPGPVHAGLTADPAAELLRLLDLLVR